jgi:Tol biopolymer transport system component
VRGLVARCLNKDPKRRLQAIGEARIALEEGGLAETAPSQSRLSWGVVPWVAAAVAVIVAVVFATLYITDAPPEQSAVRFQLAPPEKGSIGHFKLSPDGRHLAFVSAESGTNRLWVRSLDAVDPRMLAGTDGARLPFWSPDSTYLGFFADGKLRKISVNGGPAQTLADAPNGVGGTWNRDGVIVFQPGPGNGTPLMRVSSAGGSVTPVTQLAGAGGHVHPEFLPDGRHFLYFARAESKPELNGIFVGSLDGGAPVRLLPDLGNAAYGPGHLLFRRENTLMAQPFDADRLAITGDVFPIAEDVGLSGPQNYSAFSVSWNGTLVYGRGGALESQGELVWVDRTGRQLAVAGPYGGYANISLSPDEKNVAFHRFEAANADVWVRDLARGVTTRLTFHPAPDFLLGWSPDGRRIMFFSNRAVDVGFYTKAVSGVGSEDLVIKARGTLPLTSAAGAPVRGEWSRDGRFLVYTAIGERSGPDLWIAPQFGDKKPVPFVNTQFTEGDGTFSPDGRWIAYVSNESSREEVYVQPFPASGGKWQVSASGGAGPQWSREGDELFYETPDRTLMAVPVRSGSTFAPGTPKALFSIGVTVGRRNYAVAADAQRFLVVRATGDVAGAPVTVVLNWTAGLKK